MEENKTIQEAENSVVPQVHDEMGIIGPDTKVIGNISTYGHITVLGEVKDDIDAKGNVIITGKIEGNVKCHNFCAQTGSMETDVTASGVVSVNSGVTLKGTVSCGDITIAGTVIGDITSSGKVGLTSSSVVKGNIKASSMGMEIGAKLEGSVSIA